MKKLILSAFIGILSMSFTNNRIEFRVDAQQSKLTWIGRKVVGEHSGNIAIADGKLISDGKNLIGGSFEINMNSITNNDLTDQGYNQKLIGHLKSDDFFSTEKFPASKFVIKSIEPLGKASYNVKGDLTIKGITKPVEFPATIQNTGNTLKAKATIKVDRTLYGIRYGSGSFFDNLGDKAINNEFELQVELVANKTQSL